MSPKWSVHLCFCDWKVVCIYRVSMHSTYVILSSVLLHSSLNAGAGIQGTIAKKNWWNDIKQLQTHIPSEQD